jgi:hypothetical protein
VPASNLSHVTDYPTGNGLRARTYYIDIASQVHFVIIHYSNDFMASDVYIDPIGFTIVAI